MNPTRRLASLLLFLGVLTGFGASPAAAQTTNQDSRYLYADTTLVRDTLGFTFERLFPLADSLRRDPADLRALSVRYRWSLAHLIKMADSLDVPIDSVGPIMERERFNPLASTAINTNFSYTSTYSVGQDKHSTWSNTTDCQISRGARGLSATNQTTVDFDNARNGRTHTQTRRRDSFSTLGWKLSPRLSVGSSAHLVGYDNVTSVGVGSQKDHTNTFGATVNAKPPSFHGLTSSLNLTGGTQNSNKTDAQKNGPSGDANGQLRYSPGSWLSTDLRFQGSATLAKAFPVDPNPEDAIGFPTVTARDNSTNLSGSVGVFRNRPAEFLMNYRLANSRTQRPISVNPGAVANASAETAKQLVRTLSRNVDATLRLQQSSNRSLSVGWVSALGDNATASDLSSNNSRDREGLVTSGRLRLWRLDLDGGFTLDRSITRYPRRELRGGYQQTDDARSLNGKANWALTRRVSFVLEGDISLTQSRYARIGTPLTVPVPRDNAIQSLVGRFHYGFRNQGSTDLSLEVRKTRLVNIPSASTAANNEQRTYQAGWAWNYLLLTGLTVTQNNQMSANYTRYPFAATSNRLLLGYNTATTMTATLTPRMDLTVNHSARVQPGGNYRPQSALDPTEYFSLADETRNYSLNARIAYRPTNAISVSFTPDYQASARDASSNDQLLPSRRSRALNMTGSTTLNLRVGQTGHLSGDVSRRFSSNRTINYLASGPQVTPRSEISSWIASLTLTWHL